MKANIYYPVGSLVFIRLTHKKQFLSVPGVVTEIVEKDCNLPHYPTYAAYKVRIDGGHGEIVVRKQQLVPRSPAEPVEAYRNRNTDWALRRHEDGPAGGESAPDSE